MNTHSKLELYGFAYGFVWCSILIGGMILIFHYLLKPMELEVIPQGVIGFAISILLFFIAGIVAKDFKRWYEKRLGVGKQI